MPWSNEQTDRLKELFNNGYSFLGIAKRISQEFRTTFSRNAVAGRITRLQLCGVNRPRHLPPADKKQQQTTDQRNRKRRARRQEGRPMTKPKPPRVLARASRIPLHRTLLELNCEDCHWPLGGWPGDDPVTFCGLPRCGSDYPYCLDHYYASLSKPRDPA